ncbi:MAG: hypothetical protein H0X03_07160 [Nitrosopumilus sp.]|nr:hypothetical protein [Nitrosopumilus sp.]
MVILLKLYPLMRLLNLILIKIIIMPCGFNVERIAKEANLLNGYEMDFIKSS